MAYAEVINITCSSDTDGVMLKLIRSGVVLSQSDGTVNTITFRVGPLSVNDFGLYTCQVSKSGRSRSSDLDISVPGPAPPVFAMINPPQPVVPRGSSIVFDCVALAAVSFKWEKEDGELPNNTRVASNLLYIDVVTEGNVGDYICTASNENGEINATASLTLSEGKDETGSIPSATSSTTSSTLTLTTTPSKSMLSTPALPSSTLLLLSSTEVDPSVDKNETSTIDFFSSTTMTVTPRVKTGPPTISSCRGIRTAGDACLVTLEAELKEATVDCRANSQDVVKYEWTIPGDDTILSSEAVLRVPVDWTSGSRMFSCVASNTYGSTTETFQLAKNDYLPGFVNDGSYLKLDEIKDAYLSTTLEISFTPSEDTGLLLYSGAQKASDGAARDYIALGLADGLALFKFDLGSNTEEVVSVGKVKLNEPNIISISRNKKDIVMTLNGEAIEFTSGGDYIGLNLNQPLYLAGVPEGLVDDYAGYKNSFSGTVNNLIVQGEMRYFNMEDAEAQGVILADACTSVNCENEGVCINAYNDMGYQCICPKNFAGTTCSVSGENCHPGYCSNNGECQNLESGPSCSCQLGYTGDRCQTAKPIGSPSFNSNGYIQYAPLEGVSRMTKMDIIFTATDQTDGLIAYAGENQFGSGDYIALLLRDSAVMFTYDLGGGAVVIEGIPKVESGKVYKLEAERTDVEGSLVINGGIAQKASPPPPTTASNPTEAPPTTTTTQKSGGWLFAGSSSSDTKPKVEDSANSNSIGLNVKTPFFVGGVSDDYELPEALKDLPGLSGCVNQVTVQGRDLDLVVDAEEYSNIESCVEDSNVQKDDPCVTLPCGRYGKCVAKGDSDFKCMCDDGYIGDMCDIKKTACTVNEPCLNGGICEPIGTDNFKCRCIVGWTGETCETRSGNRQYAYARGSAGSVALPKVDLDDFEINSDFIDKQSDNAEKSLVVNDGSRRSGDLSRNRFHEATRPKDYFKHFFQQLRAEKDNTISSGKKACFGGAGYLELPRELMPSSSPEMSVQMTVNTTSNYGVLYWQGQPEVLNGAGQDFFGIGLASGYVKFSFELGGGPAVLMSTIPVNDGRNHVIIAKRKGRNGVLKVDDSPEVTGSSGGTMKYLNGNGNIYIGGVPHYKRMVSTSFNPGFTGCINHVKTSAIHGAIDLFEKKQSGVDVSDQ